MINLLLCGDTVSAFMLWVLLSKFSGCGCFHFGLGCHFFHSANQPIVKKKLRENIEWLDQVCRDDGPYYAFFEWTLSEVSLWSVEHLKVFPLITWQTCLPTFWSLNVREFQNIFLFFTKVVSYFEKFEHKILFSIMFLRYFSLEILQQILM